MSKFLRTLGARYDHGHAIGDHDHGWGQQTPSGFRVAAVIT